MRSILHIHDGGACAGLIGYPLCHLVCYWSAKTSQSIRERISESIYNLLTLLAQSATLFTSHSQVNVDSTVLELSHAIQNVIIDVCGQYGS